MNTQVHPEDLLARQKRANTVFTELLTSVSPEARDALVALYDLVRADLELHKCQCDHHHH